MLVYQRVTNAVSISETTFFKIGAGWISPRHWLLGQCHCGWERPPHQLQRTRAHWSNPGRRSLATGWSWVPGEDLMWKKNGGLRAGPDDTEKIRKRFRKNDVAVGNRHFSIACCMWNTLQKIQEERWAAQHRRSFHLDLLSDAETPVLKSQAEDGDSLQPNKSRRHRIQVHEKTTKEHLRHDVQKHHQPHNFTVLDI